MAPSTRFMFQDNSQESERGIGDRSALSHRTVPVLGKLTADASTRTMTALETTPVSFRKAALSLSKKQLDTLRRPGGRTVRRLIPNLPDGHPNEYVRMRTVLTQHRPTICTYDQDSWARSEAYRTTPPEISRSLLRVVHHRRTKVLEAASITDWPRTGVHPGIGEIKLADLVALVHGGANITEPTSPP